MIQKTVIRLISRLPAWTLTIVGAAVILWLTLSPAPVDMEDIPLFPGADKVAHALMFGGFDILLLTDLARRKGWHRLTGRTVIGTVLISAAFGLIVEVAQLTMEMGRSFEWADFGADFLGAAICGLLWYAFGKKGDTTGR